MNEVLGVKLHFEEIDSFDYSESIIINGSDVEIGISPIN